MDRATDSSRARGGPAPLMTHGSGILPPPDFAVNTPAASAFRLGPSNRPLMGHQQPGGGADSPATSSPGGSPWTLADSGGWNYVSDLDLPRGIGSPDTVASSSPARSAHAGSPVSCGQGDVHQDLPPKVQALGGNSWGSLPKAARDGRIDVVETLLRSGCLVSEKDRRGRSALHWASARAYREIVVLLLEHSCDPAAVDRDGATPLHLAAVAGSISQSDYTGGGSNLGDGGRRWHTSEVGVDSEKDRQQPADQGVAADRNSGGREGQTSSSPASLQYGGSAEATMEILIRAGAPLESTDRSGRTPLHFAAWRGQAAAARSLLRHRSSCIARDTDGRTPLHLAAIAGNLPVLRELLSSGASTAETDPAGRTALHLAAYWGQPKAMKELVRGGADLEAVDHDGATALQLASWRGQGECVKVLRRCGAQVARQNSAGHTAFHLAAAEGRLAVLTELVTSTSDLHVLDSEMKTLLHVAAEAGQTEVCQYLLRSGADLEAVDANLCTPLHQAVLHGREEVVDMLLRNGASVAALDEDLSTPLHFAAAEGHRRIAAALIRAGADVGGGRLDEARWTPLHQAAQSGNAAVVRLLLASGASLELQDQDGRTALQIASLYNHDAVFALLACQRSSQYRTTGAGEEAVDGEEQLNPELAQLAVVAVAVSLQRLRILLYTLSNAARGVGTWAPPARTARGGIKASARLPMSPSSDGGRHQRDFDLATALEPPQEVFEPDLKVDFIKDVKPHLGRRLGEGAFGVVYEAKWRGQRVAVKVLSRAYKGTDRKEQYDSFASEVKAMSHVGQGCDRIVRMLGACLSRPRVCIIYELLPGGCLHRRIHDKLRPPLDLLEVLRIAYDVAEGLAYLHHTADVVHRDLKPQNILLDASGRAKIIDFGLSKDIANPCQSYLLTDARGTIQYMAPEAFDCKGNFKADVYALGVIINECLTREVPWDTYDLTYQVMFAVTTKDERPAMDPNCPPNLKRLIQKCWKKDPEVRPGCHEVMHHLKHMINEELKNRGTPL